MTTTTLQPVDAYLGFEIFEHEEGGYYAALPLDDLSGYTHILEPQPDMPAMRKAIWQWWHRVEVTS